MNSISQIIYYLIFAHSNIVSMAEVEMNTVRKIELTEDQAEWLEREIANGNIASEAVFIEEAITERVHQQNMQNPKYREWLEAELQKGLDSGISNKSVDEIFAEIDELIERGE